MFKQHIKELKNISNQHLEISAKPFIPYWGENIDKDKGAPRIMYIGKATYGWGEPEMDQQKLTDLSVKFIIEDIIGGNYHSPFWSYAVDLTEIIYRASGHPFEGSVEQLKEWALKRIYWTNLVKVGGKGGNASGALLKDNINLYSDILRSEILSFKPTVIVIVANGYAQKITENIFGSDGWQQDALDPNIHWYKNSSELECNVHWTRHPQGWAKDSRMRVLSEIAKLYRSSK